MSINLTRKIKAHKKVQSDTIKDPKLSKDVINDIKSSVNKLTDKMIPIATKELNKIADKYNINNTFFINYGKMGASPLNDIYSQFLSDTFKVIVTDRLINRKFI